MPRLEHRDRELRLTFCTNVLPGTTVPAILANLGRSMPAVREAAFGDLGDAPLGLGLWLPAAAARELDVDPGRARSFAAALRAENLEVFTLNGFPFGDFHRERVKEDVFLPSWADVERLEYSLRLGRLLAGWLGEGERGSISTLACGSKRLHGGPRFESTCAAHLLALAVAFHRIEVETGRTLVLGLEPEPGCTLETTPEVVDFFERALVGPAARSTLRDHAIGPEQAERIVRRHLGVCFDACHQAVEFEDIPAALRRLEAAGIALAKLQVTSALEIRDPGSTPGALDRLARFAEPRYLHQVARPTASGIALAADLERLLEAPPPAWLTAPRWRIHFHVPVHRETVSGFSTTRDDLLLALRVVLERDLTRHLEVETYTWGVLPDEARTGDALALGMAEELRWTRAALAAMEAVP